MMAPWENDLKPAAVDRSHVGQRPGQSEPDPMAAFGMQFHDLPQQLQQEQQTYYPPPQNAFNGAATYPTASVPPAATASAAASTTNREQPDAFTEAVERVLAAVDNREEEENNMLGTGVDNHSTASGPLTATEISKLSMLCTVQSSRRQGITDNLGFADVDPDMVVQLVTHLAKHVNLSSNVSVIQATYDAIQVAKAQGKNRFNVEQWFSGPGHSFLVQLYQGLEAAGILLFIMTSLGIDRRVMNEDAIEATITLLRHNLSENILPALNNTGHIMVSRKKGGLDNTGMSASAKKRRRSSGGAAGLGGGEAALMKQMKATYPSILKTVGPTVLVMERLEALVQRVPLDDQQVFTLSSGAMLPLELDPTTGDGIKTTHQLHVSSIGVLTAIFRKYSKHRTSIVEDLFPIMLRMPVSKKSLRTYPVQCSSVLYPAGLVPLASSLVPSLSSSSLGHEQHQDSQSIQTMSAVILFFVQSCVVRPTYDLVDEENDQSVEDRRFFSGLADAQFICDKFVTQLLQRCSKKGEDGGASEFRPILANLIDDLLLIFLVPEYPAAEMILLSIAKMLSQDLMNASSSTKALQASEATYLNTAFDALGKICAAEAKILAVQRERPMTLQKIVTAADEKNDKQVSCYCKDKEFGKKITVACDQCQRWSHVRCVGLFPDAVPREWLCDACQLARIVEFERDKNTNMGQLACPVELIDEMHCMRRLLIDYLSVVTRKTGIVAAQDAYEFHLARWVGEMDQRRTQSTKDNSNMISLIERLLEMWNPADSPEVASSRDSQQSLNGMLHCLSDEGRSRMVLHLAAKQSTLLMSFRSKVGLILKLMASDTGASLRKLSVKAIEKVADADPKLMLYLNIKNAVMERFIDEAISVREAAVSLVGSYVVHTPAVANAFHQAFLTGLNDIGVSVRKRTIKILQDILCSNPKYKGKATACSEMLRLAANPKEDDGVRDLIYDLFMKVWLEHGDQVVEHEVSLPISPPKAHQALSSPGMYVLDVETTSGTGVVTPTPQHRDLQESPSVKSTRSHTKELKSKKLQARSEITSEQMVEVVKASNSEEHLTTLFRELLAGVSDTDKDRKAPERLKRQQVAQKHCAMLVDALVEILLSVEDRRAGLGEDVGKELVATIRTIGVFASVSPSHLFRHMDTLLPYLKGDNGVSSQEEAAIVSSVCNSLALLSGAFDGREVQRLGEGTLGQDLMNITYRFGKNEIGLAVRVLCSLAHNPSSNDHNPFRKMVLDLTRIFFKQLVRNQDEDDISRLRVKSRGHVQRSLTILGAICRYHETAFESMKTYDSDDDEAKQAAITWDNLPSQCQHMFLKYLEKKDAPTKCSALRALSGVFLACPRQMLEMNNSGLIGEVMSADAPPSLQMESLKCWRDILLAEEARVESGEAKAKMDSKKSITLAKKISGDQDGDATLFGAVLTAHATRLFEMTQSPNRAVRFASLDLVGNLLRQGQLNPNEAVPFLLALQGDVDADDIRLLALRLLMTEGEKRPDMLRQRVCAGVKQAYKFQSVVYPEKDEPSALLAINHHGTIQWQCVFGSVFKECIVTIKKQRQGLFRNLIGLFDMEARRGEADAGRRKKKSVDSGLTAINLPLLAFTAQVLAHLPYAAASDPLYIIYHISSNLALQGPTLLDRLSDFLRPHKLASSDEYDEPNGEEDDLELASQYSVPHRAQEAAPLLHPDFQKLAFADLCSEAAALVLLLRLKRFLRKAYNLSESRCQSYDPQAKERITEKAISKSSVAPFDSSLALKAYPTVETDVDLDALILQYSEFRLLMREESASSEAHSGESDDEDMVPVPTSATKRKRREVEEEDDDDEEEY